jgi:hypothetical protein
MKLCTCNYCGGVFEDKAPNINSEDYPNNLDFEPLIWIRSGAEFDGDKYEEFWGCPKCKEDGFLVDGLNYNALPPIDKIIVNKILYDSDPKYGKDCTEEESAFLKGYIKETILIPGSNDIKRIESIQIHFPLEYAESLDELS